LSIALALIGQPKVAVLDEMTTGLDPTARRGVWDFIEKVRDRGTTMILVTHFMDEAQRLCDRVALIDHGRIAATGTPGQLAEQAGGGGKRVRFVSRPFGLPIAALDRTASRGLRTSGRWFPPLVPGSMPRS
jgi:ABC-2 type transport system ATP-binding protein